MSQNLTDFDLILNEYHDLYEDFKNNYDESGWIKKLSTLEKWKVNIFVMYIACDYKTKLCAQMLSCSSNTVRKIIAEIKESLQN